MNDPLRQVAKALGLVPMIIETFTDLMSEFRPLPPLEGRAQIVAVACTLFFLAVTVVATWNRTGSTSRRWPAAIGLAVVGVLALLGYFAVVEGVPGHSVPVDVLQVGLWGLFFGFVASAIGLAADTLMLKFSGKG